MDDVSVSAAPAWTTVAVEQVRLVGLRFRTAGVSLFVLGLMVSAAYVWFLHQVGYGMIASRHVSLANHALSAHARAKLDVPLSAMHVSFTPAMIASILPLALLLPLAIWQDEPPARRDYHLVMPMSASTHTLLRVLGGWFWVMVFTALFLAQVVVVPAVVDWFPGALPVHTHYATWWEWIVPFTAMTVAYVTASVAAVGARRPLVWLGGAVILYVGALALLVTLQKPEAAKSLLEIAGGFYGIAAAMAGQVDAQFGVPSLARWLGATTIWGAASAALLVAVAHRRAEA